MTDQQMRSSAPWPTELDDLVRRARYTLAPTMTFRLEDGTWDDGATSGLRLIISVRHANSYHSHDCDACGQPYPGRGTQFHFPVPPTSFDRASWQRWLFDRVMDVHRHETGEALTFAYRRPTWDDTEIEVVERPFAPFHGPGRDPNRVVEVGVNPIEAITLQDGTIAPGHWWDRYVVHTDDDHEQCIGQGQWCRPVQVIDRSEP